MSNLMIEEVTVYRVIDEDGEVIDVFEDYGDAERCIDAIRDTEYMKEMVRNERW